MIWHRKGEMGMLSPPYSVGKYLVNGHLEYRLWHNDDLISECKSFEECQRKAEGHAQVMDGRT